MRRLAVGLALITLPIAAGCGPRLDTVRMGAVYMDRGPGCGVAFENLQAQEAMAQGAEQIGMINVQGVDSLDAETKSLVEDEACKMGADFVTFGAGIGQMLGFFAWKRGSSPAATREP